MKNEKTHYVSGVNCFEDSAYDDMQLTKERFNKKNGILAFHAYQSFKEGQVTPDVAHEIGIKLAEEMWGVFEVLVATHQNTKHIHNHFIINSVSYKTGKKYNNDKANYSKLRQISDSICEEYGLSVLKETDRYKNSYNNLIKNDEYYKLLKEDIDFAINDSLIPDQFLNKLKKLGYNYYIKTNRLTVWKDGYDRVRIDKIFGNSYSLERIKKKLFNSKPKRFIPIPMNIIYNNYLQITSNRKKGILGLFLYYYYLLNDFPKTNNKQHLSYSIRKDVRKLEKISEEIKFMTSNNIETYEDLKEFQDYNRNKLSNLKSKRENLWKRYHRAKTDKNKKTIYNEISQLQPIIKELNKNKNFCNSIEQRSQTISKNIEQNDNEIELKRKGVNEKVK